MPRVEPLSLPSPLRRFLWISIALTALTIAYCLVMFLVLHRGYPYDWPLFIPSERFGDFTIYLKKFALFHQASFFTTGFPFTYPAPVAVLYEGFRAGFGSYALKAFLLFSVLSFITPAVLFGRTLVARGIAVSQASLFAGATFALSWPMWLLLDRANVEVFVWVVLACGVWAYSRGALWTAAALLACAASLKLFPFVYLALFLNRRDLPKLLFGIAVFFLATLVSLAVLGPTVPIAYYGIAKGLSYFHDVYMTHFFANETGFDHSLLAFWKVAVELGDRRNAQAVLDHSVQFYIPLMAVTGIALYFLRIRFLPKLNQLLALTIASIYFTPFSGDGTLIHLYYAFALCCFFAIETARRNLLVPGLELLFGCFAFLLSTENFFIFFHHRFEGQAKCIALGILLICALRYPFKPVQGREPPYLERWR